MKLTPEEIRGMVDVERFGPVLTVDDVAALLKVSVATVYRWSSENRFSGAVRRGKPLRFLRDRLLQAFFSENPPRKSFHRIRPCGSVPHRQSGGHEP